MDNVTVFTVGDVLRKLRKARRWSLRQLAQESGIGRMTISDIERNRSNYQRDTLDALAKPFGKTGAELEAMATHPPRRRDIEPFLAPEWTAFTLRVSRLSRQEQAVFLSLLLAFEQHHAKDRPTGQQPDDQTDLREADQPLAS